jgi:N-acetylglucosamine repressor
LCLAERYYGNARELDDFAMLDVSAGVGLGVMTGGRLLAGHRGLAGEVGHLTVVEDGRPCGCGNRGCLETVAGDTALAWRASRKAGRKLTLDQALERARAGKLDLADELEETLKCLAVGVAAVINLFNPATLFIHGRLFDFDPEAFGRLVALAEKRTLAPSFAGCRIVQARGSKRQGAVAGIIQHLTSAVGPSLDLNTL